SYLSLHYLAHALFFFFNDTSPTYTYTLSLHDALPIFADAVAGRDLGASTTFTEHDLPVASHVGDLMRYVRVASFASGLAPPADRDRKSTRLNSSHRTISYAVFCLKKKKKKH